MSNPIMAFFGWRHLPEDLQLVSRPIGELAIALDDSIPDSAEKSAGLRKLLEAKDCFVRAAMPRPIPNPALPATPAAPAPTADDDQIPY